LARCFVTRSLPGQAPERLRACHETDVWSGADPPTREQLIERARDAEGLLCLLTDRIDREVLAALPRLRAISNYAVGCDNIDVEAASERGIPVGNTPDVLTDATADLTFGLMLAAARRVAEGDRIVRAGEWPAWSPDFVVGTDVHGATLGIVGMGRIGNAVAARARGFEMTVLHTGRSGGMPLEELLAGADFVSLHVPLTPETRGMIGAETLRLMKPSAILINTSRGAIVDTDALVAALEAGEIAGCGLDVTDPEPLPPEHPLARAPGAVITPHIGSASRQAREAMADLAVDNLLAALDGKPMPAQVEVPPVANRD
jgi:glyoxylate reductase